MDSRFSVSIGHRPRPWRLRTAMTALVGALTVAVPAHAQSDAQWTEWGARVHGGFGSLIAYGVVIGQDALQRLHAQRRELSVHYVDGPQTPCACVLDGVSVAVSASLGQRTLVLDEQRAEPGVLARIRFTRRDNGATVEYVLPQAMLARMAAINRDVPTGQRLAAVRRLPARDLYQVQEITP